MMNIVYYIKTQEHLLYRKLITRFCQVQPEQPYVSPSQSLTNQAEFSEEVTKISNSVTDNTNCVTDHASCVTDHASCVTDHASCMAEEGDGTKGHSDYVFPQIIFDNLTDDDNIECSNNKSRLNDCFS